MIKLTGTLAISAIFFLSSCSEPKSFESLTKAETKNEVLDACQEVYMWRVYHTELARDSGDISAEKAGVLITSFNTKSGKILAQTDFNDPDYPKVFERMNDRRNGNMTGGEFDHIVRDNAELLVSHCNNLIGYKS